VPTPRALELRQRVRRVVDDAETVLRPALKLDLSVLARSFSVRSSEGFVETFGPALIARTAREAPGVRLRFVPKPDKDSTPLRDGTVDLETGVVGSTMGPEIRTLGLFTDRHAGVACSGHPLADGKITPARYAAGPHVRVSRPGLEDGGIDEALQVLGLERDVRATVGGFASAIALARNTLMVATVPEKHTRGLCEGLLVFPVPLPLPGFTVSLFWHPRLDADPAHRWLRSLVHDVCGDAASRDNRLDNGTTVPPVPRRSPPSP
jgi:DNA-binding transcriptional LysR family regulator